MASATTLRLTIRIAERQATSVVKAPMVTSLIAIKGDAGIT